MQVVVLNAGKNRRPIPFLLSGDYFVYWCFTWTSWMCQKKETVFCFVFLFFVATFLIFLQSRLQHNTGERGINISTSITAGVGADKHPSLLRGYLTRERMFLYTFHLKTRATCKWVLGGFYMSGCLDSHRYLPALAQMSGKLNTWVNTHISAPNF